MQAGLTPSDRKLLLGAGAIAVLLLAGTVVFSPSTSGPGSAVPSTYSSGSGGALAAYVLLEDLGYPVRRWEQPPSAMTMPGPGTLLIFAEPTEAPSQRDREALTHFVELGGRILFCGISAPAFFRDALLSFPNPDSEWQEFHPNLPSSVSRGANTIVMQAMASWDNLNSSQLILYGEQQRPAMVAWRMGQGEIFWWAAATPLTNAGITRADNLRLFLNTVSPIASGAAVSIYWDEYFHGQRESLWSYVQKTPIVWGCVQLAILMACVLFTLSRRSGPLVRPAVISRLSPLEFIETMGGLYQRAGAAAIPVDVSYRRLRLALARRLALPITVADVELAQSARERLGFEDEMGIVLQDAELASGLEKLSARRALGMVQQLENYVVRLRNPPAPSGEKSSEEKT